MDELITTYDALLTTNNNNANEHPSWIGDRKDKDDDIGEFGG